MKIVLYIMVLSVFFLFSCGSDNSTDNCSADEDCGSGKICNLKSNECEDISLDPAFPLVGEKYDTGDITSEEAYALELINRARSNPKKEGEFLVNSGDSEINGGISYFKVDTEQVLSDFESYEARMPLAFNKQLMSVANFVAQMQIEYNAQGHTLDGNDFAKRFNDAGYPYSGVGEDVYAYSKNVLHSHGAFNIDWGNGPGGVQSPPGHRNTIMGIGSASSFREIGIRVENTIPSGKSVGPQIVTHDVGSRRNNSDYFITGVIYDDKNANNFYDIGEGLEGITVSADNGRYYYVTNASGSYTIPFIVGDSITKVQAYGLGFPTQVAEITLESKNYKLDFNLQKTGANGDASVGFNFLKTIKAVKLLITPKKEYPPLSFKK